MRTTRTLPVLAVLTLLTSACVTINIYFPAAAAEKAADKIIDEVWQQSGKAPAKPAEGKPADAAPTDNKPAQ